jgi:transposase
MKSALMERESWSGPALNEKARNMEAPQIRRRDDRLNIPWDLGEWVDRSTLLRWIIADVDTLDWDNAELEEFLRLHPEYQPKMLLQLLTYAYATSVFESGEVETVFFEDEGFRSLGWKKPPTGKSISRFRRENRGLFKWTIFQVLQRAIRTRFDLGDRLLPAGLKRYLVEHAIKRIDLARHMDCAEQEN